MTPLRAQIDDAVKFLRTKTSAAPSVGIILGTGLGGLVKEIAAEVVIDYSDIPHFPVSTVESHKGKLIFGTLGGKSIVAMQLREALLNGLYVVGWLHERGAGVNFYKFAPKNL